MNWLNVLTAGWTGYRTHSAVLLSVLTGLATAAGMLPTATGHSLALGLAALALTFSRFAQSDLAAKLDRLLGASNSPGASPTPTPSPTGPDTRPFPRILAILAMLAMLCLTQRGHSQDQPPGASAFRLMAADRPTVLASMSLSPEARGWFRNPDGSCVQCSIGMAGANANNLNAASLLWDSPYGAAVRGGSWPSRVEAYCDARGIKAWSVTAASVDDTIPWMVWAARTGRFAAIGAGRAHFQTLYGFEPGHAQPWLVCNNNSPERIDRYGEADFKRLHAASGPWVVILEQPSSDPPSLKPWWK